MIIIGEKINGSIPAVKEAIETGNDEFIRERARAQTEAGADYLDCAPGTVPEIEYDTMCHLIDVIQEVSELPLCIDSPNPKLLARVIEEGRVKKPGFVNSVSGEAGKFEAVFPVIAGTDWNVIGLTCDMDGIPMSCEKKLDIAKRIIDTAGDYGIAPEKLHIDPCLMAIAAVPSALEDLVYMIQSIHSYAPGVKVAAAISNISFGMPARKYVNAGALAYASEAGLDTVIMDPCGVDMRSMAYACEVLLGRDKNGRQYNRAYRKGLVGIKK